MKQTRIKRGAGRDATKIVLTAIVGITLVLSPRVSFAQTSHKPSTAPLQGPNAIESLKQQGLYDSLHAAVAAEHYNVVKGSASTRWAPPSTYHARNAHQRYEAYFAPNGVSLGPGEPVLRDDATSIQSTSANVQATPWRAAMRLTAYGYGEHVMPAGTSELTAQDNRVEYRRPGMPIIEWYVNKAAGLEQGFDIAMAPGTKFEGEKLRLILEVTGNLKMELAEGGGDTITFRKANGEPALNYSNLHAHDAKRRNLPAQMRVNDGHVILEVDDGQAVYPVTIDPTFSQQARLNAFDGAAEDGFGSSVAVSNTRVVVGVPFDDVNGVKQQGSAYVFALNNGSWNLEAKLTARDGAAGDKFGSSVAISAGTIAVGAPGDNYLPGFAGYGSAYVFEYLNGSWTERQRLFGNGFDRGFGSSVAVDSIFVLVGQQSGNSAYLFSKSGSLWTLQSQLTPSGQTSQYNNVSVAIGFHQDVWPIAAVGLSNALVGGVPQGAVYVFGRDSATGLWRQEAELTASNGTSRSDGFGRSVAMDWSGKMVVGSPGYNNGQGAAYVFQRATNRAWSLKSQLTPATMQGRFGFSVSIARDTVVVGAPYQNYSYPEQGLAYVFQCSATTCTQQQQRLTASDAAAIDRFGGAVAINPISNETDKRWILVGAPLKTIGRIMQPILGSGLPFYPTNPQIPSGNTAPNFYQGAAYVFTY